MKKFLKFAAYLLIAEFVFISCQKEEAIPSAPAKNLSPFADAGEDQVIKLPVDNIVLNGSGIDYDGYVNSYIWSQISGPNASTILSANTAQVEVKNMVQGIYEFELKVTDNKALFARDTVVISVLDSIDFISPWDY
jgi:hypothetical protein